MNSVALGGVPDMGKKPKTVVIAEADALVREALTLAFARAGYRALAASDGVQIDDIAARDRIDVLLLDVQLPLNDGIGTLLRIGDRFPGVVTYLMSSGVPESDPYFVKLALKFGINGVIRKPLSPDRIVEIVASEGQVPQQAGVA